MENIARINAFYQENETAPTIPIGIYRACKKTPQEATWACSTCGLILPYRVKSGVTAGQWIRNKCACQLEEARIKANDEISEVRQRNFITKTFAWLGSEYADLELAKKTFANFDNSCQQQAYDAASQFAGDLCGNIILHSKQFGTGKTHLLAAICNQLRLDSVESRFVTAPKLFRAIQDCMQNKEPYADIIFKAVTVPFLVIDDVDKVKETEWKEERYFEIIDERAKSGRPTGISTNKYDDLAKYIGGAAFSRLKIGKVVVEMRPDDYREKL